MSPDNDEEAVIMVKGDQTDNESGEDGGRVKYTKAEMAQMVEAQVTVLQLGSFYGFQQS